MGTFITFEGPEGCGKTTQCARFAAFLRNLGIDAAATKEPGGTEIGLQIREILLSLKNKKISPLVELLLFSADRADHVLSFIRPCLEEGKVVVCDRFYDSTLAYQGYGHGYDLTMVNELTAIATAGLKPDFTFLLDLDVRLGLQRRRANGVEWNRLDDADIQFHRRVRGGYRQLSYQDSRFLVVDASASVEEVWVQIENLARQKILPCLQHS